MKPWGSTSRKHYGVVTLATTLDDPVKFTNVRELKPKTSEMLRTVERENAALVTRAGGRPRCLSP